MAGLFYNIIWWSAVIADGIAAVALVYLLLSIPKIKSSLRTAMTLLFIGASFAVASSAAVAGMSVLQLDVSHTAWNLLPLLFPVAMVFFVISMRQLVVLFEDILAERRS
jgi:hypothetical protein